VATKWRAVASDGHGRPVVIANGAESEPASCKDAFMLTRAPHLVLDGLVAATQMLHASRAIVYVAPSNRAAVMRAVGNAGGRDSTSAASRS